MSRLRTLARLSRLIPTFPLTFLLMIPMHGADVVPAADAVPAANAGGRDNAGGVGDDAGGDE